MGRQKFSAVDLFAGAGGLTLGLHREGFRVRAAVEVNRDAASSYRKNFPDVLLIERDVRLVRGKELLAAVPNGRLNLMMGCAPCQGFCSLTQKVDKEDPRNELILEMARLVEETRPDMVLMENVPGLLTRGRHLFQQFLSRLDAAGYFAQWRVIQMADYGVPQNRRRLVLLAGRGFAVPFPEPTHARKPTGDNKLKPWLSLRDAIGGERAPVSMANAQKRGSPQMFNWHIVRDLQPQTKARLRAALPGKTWLDIESSLRPECHQGDYKGFSNVYGRMRWDQLPVTITAGCTTPAKGRFGHPNRQRTTISVREAATIQTFPKSFRFASNKIDVVCSLIGNAVPPLFAAHLASEAHSSLRKHYAALR